VKQDRALVERSTGSTYGEADGWVILCAADAELVLDGDDADIIDAWLATIPAREFGVILSHLLT